MSGFARPTTRLAASKAGESVGELLGHDDLMKTARTSRTSPPTKACSTTRYCRCSALLDQRGRLRITAWPSFSPRRARFMRIQVGSKPSWIGALESSFAGP
jgi:hypothetical protein